MTLMEDKKNQSKLLKNQVIPNMQLLQITIQDTDNVVIKEAVLEFEVQGLQSKVREKGKFVLFAYPSELHSVSIYKYFVIILENTILMDFGIVCMPWRN